MTQENMVLALSTVGSAAVLGFLVFYNSHGLYSFSFFLHLLFSRDILGLFFNLPAARTVSKATLGNFDMVVFQ